MLTLKTVRTDFSEEETLEAKRVWFRRQRHVTDLPSSVWVALPDGGDVQFTDLGNYYVMNEYGKTIAIYGIGEPLSDPKE